MNTIESQYNEALHEIGRLRVAAPTPITDEYGNRMRAAVARADGLRDRLERARGDEAMLAEVERLTGGAAAEVIANGRRHGRGSFADQIARSEFGQFLTKHRGKLSKSGPAWTSPEMEIGGFGGGDFLATTITEDPASAGGLVLPDVVPGIVPLPTRPLVVADLLGSGTTGSNAVTVMAEKSITNAAAPVAEGALKPESTIVFEAVNEPVKKIATWIPVSEEAIEDIVGLAAYMYTRLGHFVRLEEDNQLLNGSGIGANFTGLVNRAGQAAPIARVDPENNADAIARQIAAIETATQMPVSGIVMNPDNWAALLLLKTSAGEYIAGGGPFGTPLRKTLWGREVAVTPAQLAGTATVGAFQTGAAFRRRTPVRVTASNSHADFFIKNLIALVAEERGALVVYRAAAFGQVTNLTSSVVAPGV